MEKCDEGCWTEPKVLITNESPVGFEDWCKKITCEKYVVTLPDTTNINIRMYMDFQGVFDYGSYTNYLLNRYKEIYG